MGTYKAQKIIIWEIHMNYIKYFFYTAIFIASHNAIGMMGFGHALRNSKTSGDKPYELLGRLYVHPDNQTNFFNCIYTNNTNDPMFQQLVKEAELQKFKASEKENPVIANLKNSKYIFDGYALKKIASKEKKLTIVLSERNK